MVGFDNSHNSVLVYVSLSDNMGIAHPDLSDLELSPNATVSCSTQDSFAKLLNVSIID